jgi:hypothetical protein
MTSPRRFVEELLAPRDDRQIVLVDRYNLALVAARPRRASQDPTQRNPSNHDEIVRTTEGENA